MYSQKKSHRQLTLVDTTHQIIKLLNLLEAYYAGLHASWRKNDEKANHIDIVLINALHGSNTEQVDAVNAEPIEFFKMYNASVKKEQTEPFYWSNSVITIDVAQIANMIEKLQSINKATHQSSLCKPMAMS